MTDKCVTALCGVVALLITDTLSWSDMLKITDAWDTTVWLGGLVALADQLTEVGVAQFVGEKISEMLSNVQPMGAVVVLSVVYFYTMYTFCSLTGHIVAFSGPFLEVRIMGGYEEK